MNLVEPLKNVANAIATSPAVPLSSVVRLILLQYYLHTSATNIIEFIDPNKKAINLKTPVHFSGEGKIRIAPNVMFGAVKAPGNLNCSYISALNEGALISFGANTALNNSASIICTDTSITIGERCLIGPEVIIGDSNGHDLPVANRIQSDSRPKPVVIGNDVLIGTRVIILKGVTIGNGCVIAAGAVVMPGFTAPDNKIIAGNPATIIKDVRQ